MNQPLIKVRDPDYYFECRCIAIHVFTMNKLYWLCALAVVSFIPFGIISFASTENATWFVLSMTTLVLYAILTIVLNAHRPNLFKPVFQLGC